MMKYLFLGVVSILSMAANSAQFATSYGKIVHIRAYGDLNPNMPTYIQVEGIPVRETCAHQNFGHGDLNYWLIKPEEKHLLSIALAAFTAGDRVKVTSSDTNSHMVNGEVCRVVYLDVER